MPLRAEFGSGLLHVEIKSGEKNEVELDLKKRTAQDPKPLPND